MASPAFVHSLFVRLLLILALGCAWGCMEPELVVAFEGMAGRVMFMIRTAQNTYRNYRQKGSTWREVLPDDPVEWASRSPVERLEARDLLRKIAAHPNVARLLLSAAEGRSLPEREHDAGMTPGTYYVRITSMQRWARKVATSGVWRRPPMPDPPTPKHRKKKR